MKELACSNVVCSNNLAMTDDPLKEWCNDCYPKRVDKEERSHRDLKRKISFVDRHWRVPKWRSK